MKPEYEMLEEIDVVRAEDGEIHVFGRSRRNLVDLVGYKLRYYNHIVPDANTGQILQEDSFMGNEPEAHNMSLGLSAFFSLLGIGIPFLINELKASKFERRRKTKEYWRSVYEFQNANMADLREAVKDIKVYQGELDEVSQELGLELERVDTGKPETFIKGEDTFWLRVEAYSLGADAVVHYQPGSSIGTPVRYVDKKG